MFEKMKYLETEADELRKRMLREPRGFPAANCNLILPPTLPDAHAGYVIMEQTEYPVMSGTNTICVTTALIETGMVPVEEPVTKLLLESPAGPIPVTAEVDKRQSPPRHASRTSPRFPHTSTRPSKFPSSGASPWTCRGAGCSTSSPTPPSSA